MKTQSPHLRLPGPGRQTGTATVRADPFLQKPLHPLHALLILHLCQGIFHRVGGIIIGKIHLSGLIGRLGFVKNMLLFRRTVIHDIPLFLRQFPKRHVRTHPHGPAHIRHQRPHERTPGCHRPLVNGQRFIRHQRRLIHRPHNACAAARPAGALAVKRQLFRRRRIKMYPAHRAHQIVSRRHAKGRLQYMPVGAPMVRCPGKQ